MRTVLGINAAAGAFAIKMTTESRRVALPAIAGRIAPGVGIIGATYIAATTWERVKTRPPDRTIEVTGSAKKRIVSDLIEWTGAIEDQDPADRTAAYRTLHGHMDATQVYLRAQGIKDDDSVTLGYRRRTRARIC